jgi:hypothetical protein
MPKLYDELAEWFPLLSPPADYEEEAAFYARTLEAADDAAVRGTGSDSRERRLRGAQRTARAFGARARVRPTKSSWRRGREPAASLSEAGLPTYRATQDEG